MNDLDVLRAVAFAYRRACEQFWDMLEELESWDPLKLRGLRSSRR